VFVATVLDSLLFLVTRLFCASLILCLSATRESDDVILPSHIGRFIARVDMSTRAELAEQTVGFLSGQGED
jgi:hypothetical protein